MNKKLILIVVAIVAIVGLIVFSLNYPPVEQSDVSGSFKKADKYREGNVENNDVILRTEFLSDTVKLKQAIKDLIAFGDFSLQLKGLINEWWIPVLQKYNSGSDINDALEVLNHYSEFIDNNTVVLQNTINTLADLYSHEKSEANPDVEANIKQFYSYVNQFLLRDSIFELTISKIDNTVQNDKLRKNEIQNLLALRDRIVVDNFMYAVAIGDTAKVTFSMNQRINNVYNIPANLYENFNFNFDVFDNTNSAIIESSIADLSAIGLIVYSQETYNSIFVTDISSIQVAYKNIYLSEFISPAAFGNVIGTQQNDVQVVYNKIDGAQMNQFGLGMFNQSGSSYGFVQAAMNTVNSY